jgi:hypothetical protein
MPPLTQHQSNKFTKLLLIGDSGTGKTGALASLVGEGYDLRILDCDNGLDTMAMILKEKHPDKLGQVHYETVRDKYKGSAMGPLIDGAPAFAKALGLLDKWTDGTKPAEWGEKTIFVLDSLTFFSDMAFNWAKSLNPGAKEPRQWYGTAQAATENVLAQLTSADFKTNVIVISHISWIERPDGTMRGYPSSVGKALGPTIPAYFNSVALCQTAGTGAQVRRTIQTVPTALIDLKNPAPFRMAASLPLETGLADFFREVRK